MRVLNDSFGQGSSAVQLVTSLQPKVAKLVNYVREGTWVCPPVGFEMMMKLLGRDPSASGTTSALMTIAFTGETSADRLVCSEVHTGRDRAIQD